MIKEDILKDAIRTCIEYRQEIKKLQRYCIGMLVVDIFIIIGILIYGF